MSPALPRFAPAVAAGLLTLAVPGPAPAIQAGERDVQNTFSNVAILRFIDTEGTYPTDRWRCTGTLVAPTIIITAAHCTEAPVDTVYYSFNWQGPLGEPDAKAGIPPELRNDRGWTLGGTNTDGSQNIFTDPDWDGDLQIQSLDDIGIIVLDKPVTGIEPAEIAPLGYLDGTRRGTLFTVAGYGVRFAAAAGADRRPGAPVHGRAAVEPHARHDHARRQPERQARRRRHLLRRLRRPRLPRRLPAARHRGRVRVLRPVPGLIPERP